MLWAGQVGSDDSQIIAFWRTHHVHGTIFRSSSQHQATVTTHIVRIVLDQFSVQDDGAHFLCRDHPVGRVHLADSVGQEENPLCSRFYHLSQRVLRIYVQIRAPIIQAELCYIIILLEWRRERKPTRSAH
jgi:hypothetical protein